MTLKEEFLSLITEIKKTGIVDRIYSAKDAKEIKRNLLNFLHENTELISKIKMWESKYIDDYEGTHKIFKASEKISDPMEIVICIRLMNTGGIEISIFEDENDLSDELSKIDNRFAKRLAQLSYDNTVKNIQIKDIFKEV